MNRALSYSREHGGARGRLNRERWWIHLIFVLLCAAYVIPLWMVFSTSITTQAELATSGFKILPREIDFEAYRILFKSPQTILNAYKVTVITSFTSLFLYLLMGSMCAYALSRRDFAWRHILSFYLFFTMLFSGGLVSTYLLNTKYLHLRNTYWALILPNLGNVWHVFLMRTYFQDIPESILESATIDGANEWQKYLLIVLPLAVPSLATIGLLNFVSYWNSWYSALLYISEKSMRPLQYMLQIMLRNITEMKKAIEKGGDAAAMASVAKMPSEPLQMAMCIVAIGPVLLIFPFFQKYLSKGLTVGSVKG